MVKKLITLSLLLISTITAWSQSYFRASEMTLGTHVGSNIVWEETEKSSVLIKVEEKKITIYSKTRQVYRGIKIINRGENFVKWLCLDDDAKKCHVIITHLEDQPGIVLLGVSYDDLIWFYTTEQE
jgi:hypothetical protein